MSTPLKNFLFMVSGNFGAQFVSILFYPFLVRLFSPNDFGIYGTFSSTMVIAAIFASGQLHMAFIKCQDDRELGHLLWYFRQFSFAGLGIVTLVVVLLSWKLHIFPLELLILFPFALASYMAFESRKMLGVREEAFKQLSATSTGNRLGSNVLKILLGKYAPTALTLVGSEILANTLAFFHLNRNLKVKSKKPEDTKTIIERFKDFPRFATFSTFFQLGLIEAPVLFLALYYNEAEIGYYVLILRVLLQPLAIIGNSTGSVASKKLVANFQNKISNSDIITKLYVGYFLLGIVIFICAYFLPESFFSMLLGPNWQGIKEVLLPLSLLSVAKLSSGLHIYHYIAIEAVRLKSIWKALQLGSIVVIIFCFHHLPFTQLLWILSGTEATIDIAFTIMTIWNQRRSNT